MKTRRIAVWGLLTSLGLLVGAHTAFGQGGTTGGGGATGGGGSGSSGGGGNAQTIGISGVGSGGSASTSGSSTSVSAPPVRILATSSGNGSSTGIPSSSNPWVSWYGDPMSFGLPSKFLNGPPSKPGDTFGKALYTTTTTTNTAASPNNANQAAAGFNTAGIVRNPQYATVLSEDLPIVVHDSDTLLATVRGDIARASMLKSKDTIQVNIKGGTIILTGQVATERERNVVEGRVRWTPGVREVQNELKVVPR
jgi:hypothetical protein